MTYPAVPLGDQWQHRTLANSAGVDMHAKIDGPLNAGAAKMRAQPGDNAISVALRSTATIANGATVRFDTVLRDTLGAYNATTGVWTAPATGIYLTSIRLTNGAPTGVVAVARLYGLDTSIYPTDPVRGSNTAAVSYDSSEISGFPLVVQAGAQFAVRVGTAPSSSPYTPDNATIPGSDRVTWTIQYVGEFTGLPNPGSEPPSPLVGDQWIDGETVHDLKLFRRFDQPMDVLQPFLTDYGAQRAAFLGTFNGKATPTDGDTGLALDVEYDTGGGWRPEGPWWIPPVEGLYVVSGSIVSNADVSIAPVLRGGNAGDAYGPNRPAGGGATFKGASTSVVRYLTTSDAVSLIASQGVTTTTEFGTWLAATQIG